MTGPAFILGAPRSGTTLLRVMLAGHPRLFSPPEMVLAPFDTMREREAHMLSFVWEEGGLLRALIDLEGGDAARARAAFESMRTWTTAEVYAELQRRAGGRMLVDKCTHLAVGPAARLAEVASWFPEARFIHIVRHPGSVIRSIETMPSADRLLAPFDGRAENVWAHANENIASFLARVPRERWTMLRYEDLVADARPELERVCATLGVEFDEATLDPYEGDRMREARGGASAVGDPNMAARGRIDPSLATEWLRGFDASTLGARTRRLARDLGYELTSSKVGARDSIERLFDTARAALDLARMPSELDVVEGERFLLRVLSAATERFVEYGDAGKPRFHDVTAPNRRFHGDSPDVDRHRAAIQPAPGRAYRVRGRAPRGTTYFGFELIDRAGNVRATLHDRDLDVDAAGRFEIAVEHGGLACGEETAIIATQYFADRARELPLELEIERVGDPLPRLSPSASMSEQVERARAMVESVLRSAVESWKTIGSLARNRLVDMPAYLFRARDEVRYRLLWFRIERGQVLQLRGRMPKSRYFGLALHNAWFESLDASPLNQATLRCAADGTFTAYAGDGIQDCQNALDTAGHEHGYLTVRALFPEEEVPPLSVELIAKESIDGTEQRTAVRAV